MKRTDLGLSCGTDLGKSVAQPCHFDYPQSERTQYTVLERGMWGDSEGQYAQKRRTKDGKT